MVFTSRNSANTVSCRCCFHQHIAIISYLNHPRPAHRAVFTRHGFEARGSLYIVPKIKEHLRRWGPAKLLLSLCLSSGRGCTFLAWSILQSLPMHAWGFALEAKQFPPNRNRGLPYNTAMPQAYLAGWPMKKSSTATFDYIWPSWTRLSILEVLISQGFAPSLSPLA